MLKSVTGTSCLPWWVCYGPPLLAHCFILSDILVEYISCSRLCISRNTGAIDILTNYKFIWRTPMAEMKVFYEQWKYKEVES